MNNELSIIILTNNSMGIVQRLVDALREQENPFSHEVIFMDNNSSDGTVDYLNRTPFENRRVIHVPEGEFSHSRTRMQAARAATGEMIVFFTDDIIPIGKHFLSNLVAPVAKKIAPAAYGVYQINEKECDPIDAYLHNPWYNGHDEITGPITEYAWTKFPPLLKRKLSNFDNCASCFRRDYLISHGLPDVPYGEDMMFAKRLLLMGEKIALAKDARFYHWHRVSFSYLMKRMCIDQYLGIKEFDVYYVRRKLGVVKAILIRILHRTTIGLFKLKIPLAEKIYWILYNIKTLTADFLGKYIGVLPDEAVNGRSLVNRKLVKLKKRIVNEIYQKSIKRY